LLGRGQSQRQTSNHLSVARPDSPPDLLEHA
jgi:hypothetical protein